MGKVLVDLDFLGNYSIYMYIPGAPMTSFEGQPAETRPKLQPKQGAPFGFQVYIYVCVYIYIYYIYIYHPKNLKTSLSRIELRLFFPKSHRLLAHLRLALFP